MKRVFDQYTKMMKKEKKKSILLLIISLAIAFGAAIGLLFLTNEDNKILMIAIISILFIFFGSFSIYFMIEGIIINAKRIKNIEKIISNSPIFLKGVVTSNEDKITINRASRCHIIEIKDDNGKTNKLYLDDSVRECPFKVGDVISVNVSMNYIVEYEVISDEER